MRAALLSVLTLMTLGGCSLLGGATVEEMQLTTGECITDPSVSDGGEQEVGVLPTIDCAEPHYGEVFYTEDLTADEYPDDVLEISEGICLDQFEGYTGTPYAESMYYMTTIYPTSGSWRLGDRQVACLLTGDVDEELTGSARGTGL